MYHRVTRFDPTHLSERKYSSWLNKTDIGTVSFNFPFCVAKSKQWPCCWLSNLHRVANGSKQRVHNASEAEHGETDRQLIVGEADSIVWEQD